MLRGSDTSGRYLVSVPGRTHRWLLVAAMVAGLVATACSDVSDDSDGDSDSTNGDPENGQEQGQSTNGESEPSEANNHDQTLRLTVDSVVREDDLVVIEGTLTNTSDERFLPTGEFTEPDYGGLERFTINDLSGFVVIDWQHSTAHYPARTDAGDCACTIIEDYVEAGLDPGGSMDYFVAYRLDDPPAELTLVAPGFLPVDGLPVEHG